MTKLDITLRPYLGVDDLKRVLRPLGCLGIFILLGHYLLDIVYEITGHDVLLIVHREKTASDIDFLIIDYHLDKQVSYKGIDVLKEIRKYDDTIYSVLLTNYDLDNFKEEFGEYDYEIAKKEFSNQYKNIAEKIKRGCEIRKQNQISKNIEDKIESDRKVISLLEEIKSKLD